MTNELETAAGASAGGWLRWRRKQADIAPGTPCANCQTPLVGTYCHACGQLAEDFHKSIWKLGREALESFFHLDGRLARTLPWLIVRPGRLTRDYIDGKRAFQVPPLRMFLVVLLLTFLVGQCTIGRQIEEWGIGDPAGLASQGARNTAVAEIEADETLTEAERRAAIAAVQRDWAGVASAVGEAREEELARSGQTLEENLSGQNAFEAWLGDRVRATQEEPRRFALLLGMWAQRVAILALPVSAMILTCLFFWRRDVFVFDHLIFSMHSLSFQLLLLTGVIALALWLGPWAWSLLWLSPVHLFVHMREAYRSNAVMTLLRMSALFILTNVAASFMMMLWLFLAFNEMSG